MKKADKAMEETFGWLLFRYQFGKETMIVLMFSITNVIK